MILLSLLFAASVLFMSFGEAAGAESYPERYYTLAVWANKRVVYDWDFWNGSYDFDYYL